MFKLISGLVFLLFLLQGKTLCAQGSFNYLDSTFVNSAELDSFFKDSDPLFKLILKQPTVYPFQLIISIKDSAGGIKDYTYGVKPKEYFYPASLVKLPIILLACEKINELNIPGLSIYSTMYTDTAGPCQTRMLKDKSARDSLPTLANYFKKMLLVSDNAAFNRVYEFLGYEYIQAKLTAHGYFRTRIVQKLEGMCDSMSYRRTNPVCFLNSLGDTLYYQKAEEGKVKYNFPYGNATYGKGYYYNGKLVKKPKDFTLSNFIPLPELHQMMLSLFDSVRVTSENSFYLTKEQKSFIANCMRMYPEESDFPSYSPLSFPFNYKKHLYWQFRADSLHLLAPRYANVIGRAYGFFSETGCLEYKGKKILFSYVIFCSKNQYINRKNYEYLPVSLPFTRELRRLFKLPAFLEK